MPRRSTGCKRCLQRRIRCDEQRPYCQNCIRSGILCPGYRTPVESDLRFVDQTSDVLRRVGTGYHKPMPVDSVPAVKGQGYRWHHDYVNRIAVEPLNAVSGDNVHRNQLLSTFLELYLPKKRDDSMTSNFGYLIHLSQIDISSQLLKTSIDCLCLAELGSLYQDERCIQESRTQYIRALRMLARELARPKAKQMRSDLVLAAITILALCELFGPIRSGSESGKGWIHHVHGAERFLFRNGAKCASNKFGKLLFHNIRHSSVCLGLANRKAVPFAEPSWRKITEEVAKTDAFVALYDLVALVPVLLERSDLLLSGKNTSEDQVKLSREICALRLRLTNWRQKHHDDYEESPYEVVSVRDMETFAHLCLDRTFQTVFDFQHIQICNQFQLYWISCLNLDFTLLGLGRKSRLNGDHDNLHLREFDDRYEEDVERDMFVTATNYCRSVPYCCEPGTASAGRQGSFFLKVVENYFEHFGHCNELEWCKSVRQIFNASPEAGQSPPSVGVTSTATLQTAQANIKHQCKSTICNFRVECCAPAPLLMSGECPHLPCPRV